MRTPEDIADALVLLGAVAQEIDIVDPYFDLRPGRGGLHRSLAVVAYQAFIGSSDAKSDQSAFRFA